MKNNIVQKPILENNCLTGFILITDIKQSLKVSFDLEKDVSNINEFDSFIEKSQIIIKKITKITIRELLKSIAKDLTDSSYSQSDYQPISEDYLNLENDLNIIQLNFYEDDIVIDLLAPKIFPEMSIYCQIDHNFEIIDLGIA